MAGTAKKVYMEKPVSSGVLFWEILLKRNETVCKTGKVGSRCNENPPNQHASLEEAQNFVKYLVEQKRKQGFEEVGSSDLTFTKSHLTPVRDDAKDIVCPPLPTPDRTPKKVAAVTAKKVNGAKPTKPISRPISKPFRAEVKPSKGPPARLSQDGPNKTPGSAKRGRPPKSDGGPPQKSEDRPLNDSPPAKRGRPSKQATPKMTQKIESSEDEPKEAPRCGRPLKVTESLSKAKTVTVAKKDEKGVFPVVRARGRPRKEQTMETEDGNEEEEMEALVSRESTTSQLCDKLEKSNLQSSETVEMKSVDTVKKWEEHREKKSETDKSIPASPRVSLRDPSKRKMTSKYEMFMQETLGRKRRLSEMEFPEEKPSPPAKPIKKASTTATIRQGLSKTSISQKSKAVKDSKPQKKTPTDEVNKESKEGNKEGEKKPRGRGRPPLLAVGKARPPLRSVSSTEASRVKAIKQAKLTMIKPKLSRPPLLNKKTVVRTILTAPATASNKPNILKRKHSDSETVASPTKVLVLQKASGLVKRMSAAEFAASLVASGQKVGAPAQSTNQMTDTPIKAQAPAPAPSKLQMTPSRMAQPPAKLLSTPAKREDSPQPVIKRRVQASDTELTIASEFGTVFKPSVDDWPAFIPAPVVWQVPLITNNMQCNGQTVLVDPDKCLIADDRGKVIELDPNAVPTRTWTLPSGVHCMVESRFRIYVGCADASIYEVAFYPRLLTKLDEFGKLLSIDARLDNLAVSDQQGKVALLNRPDGSTLWTTKSSGEFGWMVHIDDTGVYHGHTKGVTKYSLQNGARMYHVTTDDNVLDGVQNKDFLYVSCGPYVLKIDKIYGSICRTYDKGAQYTDLVHSVAVGGGLVYAGGSKIACYDEVCGELVYCFDLPFNPAAIQYFSGRLFCVGPGLMSVIDFSPTNIEKAMDGEAMDPISIIPVQMAHVPAISAPAPPSTVTPAGPTSTADQANSSQQNVITVHRLTMKRQ